VQGDEGADPDVTEAAPQKLVLRGGRPVAGFVAEAGEEAGIAEALQRAGYEVADNGAAADGGPATELREDCEEGRDEKPCQLTAALGLMQHIGQEAGVTTAEIDALFDPPGQAVTDAQAMAAIEAVRARLPGDSRPAGDEVVQIAREILAGSVVYAD
jgi:hypothetical protein